MDRPSKSRFLNPSGQRLLVLAIAGGLISIAATVYVLSRYRPLWSSAVPIASPTVVVRKVTALGRLEPRGESVHLSSSSSLEGNRILELLVKEGDPVRKDQVIAILDTRDRRAATLKESQNIVKVAQSKLAQVQAGAKSGEIQAQQSTIRRMQAELQGNVTAQTSTVARLSAELRNAKTEYDRYRKLYREGAIAASTLDGKRLAVETAQAQLEEGQATLERLRDSVQAQLNEARANLTRIEEVRPTDVQAAQAEIDRAKSGVEKAKADLDLAYVRSPRDGRVLQVHIRPGEVVNDQAKGVMEIGRTDQIDVVAEVYETDINRVRIGQKATVTSTAFPGTLRGTVARIGWEVGKKDVLSTDPAAATDVRVVEVKIQLDRASSQRVAGLSNLQVTAEILQ